MNPGLDKLHAYPFEKLTQLLNGCDVAKNKSAISLAIGEPKHPTPQFILDELTRNLSDIAVICTLSE